MVNSEETLKMRNVSIRLVDIAKRCKKEETSIKLDKIFIGKDAQLHKMQINYVYTRILQKKQLETTKR